MVVQKRCLLLMLGALLVAPPSARAVITVTGNEIWDGIQNPHAANGVTLSNNVYTIPDELVVSSESAIFLQDFNSSPANISDSITFEFTGSGGLTFADDTGFIDIYIGGRNQMPFGSRNFTLNMNANNIAGSGSIVNGIFVFDEMSGDPMNLVVDSLGDVSLGTVDLRRNDAFGGAVDITAAGNVALDNLLVGDVSAGGSSSPNVNITAESITLGDVDTRSLRGDGNATNGNVFLTALAPPDFTAANIAGNTVAQNSVTLTGTVNTNGPGPQGGNIRVTSAKVTLGSGFATDLAGNGTLEIATGIVGGAFNAANLFINNSGVTPDAVGFTVFHDGLGPQIIEWDDDVSGDWFNDGNWDFNVAPNLNTQTTLFGAAITSPRTVFTNAPATVKGLRFDTASTVALAGTGTITLDANTGNASIEALQGSHQIQAAIALADNTTVTASAGATLDFNNAVNTGGRTLTITGAGQVNLNHLVSGGGNVTSSATLGTAGSTDLSGNLTSSGVLEIDIAGVGANRFDSFDVAGTANLSGQLRIDLADGFAPSNGATFDVVTAASITASGLSLSGESAGFSLSIIGGGNLTADADSDGDVDGSDFLQLQRTNIARLGDWQDQFGSRGGGGAGQTLRLTFTATAAAAAVPEPATVFLWVLSMGSLLGRSRSFA